MRVNPVATSAALVAILAVVACGCAGSDDADPASGSASGPAGGDAFTEVMSLLPADTGRVSFVARDAAARRLGVADLAGSTDQDDVVEYGEAFGTDPVPLSTSFASSVATEDGPIDDGDIVWGADAQLGTAADDEGRYSIYRVEDDIDLEAVADDLEELGFERSEEWGAIVLEPTAEVTDGLDGGFDLPGGYPGTWAISPVVLEPDRNLLLQLETTGPDEALAALGGEESLADAGTFDDVLDQADGDEVQYAYLNAYDPCPASFTLARFTAEQAALFEGLGTAPRNAYLATVPDGGEEPATVALLDFDDADAAAADAAARADYLADGVTAGDAQPVTDLGTAEVSQDDDVVRLDLTLDTPSSGARYAEVGDPFVVCGEPFSFARPSDD